MHITLFGISKFYIILFNIIVNNVIIIFKTKAKLISEVYSVYKDVN